MANQPTKKRRSAEAQDTRRVRVTVGIRATTLARVSALAALRGQTRNAFLELVIDEAARACVVIDKSRAPGSVDLSSSEVSSDAA
jgi:hypothetical protein